ncbi:MAG: enolase C-terminal domain-like protein [Pirellulales bacterium]
MKRPLSSDIRVTGGAIFLLPIATRLPLKFGDQVVNEVTLARITVEVQTTDGRHGIGWGETPLNVQWGWPANLSYQRRHDAMVRAATASAQALYEITEPGHPMELGVLFRREYLDDIAHNAGDEETGPVPELAALIAASASDLAVHDAYGNALHLDTYKTYDKHHMRSDLVDLFGSELRPEDQGLFAGRWPADFLELSPSTTLSAWHLVGGLDPLEQEELQGTEPNDGYPILLADWIQQDGLQCLKIKLRGNDITWDIERLQRVGRIGLANGVKHFCADFNCMVTDPSYVHAALDSLSKSDPDIASCLLYVEQPFPYDLDANPIDVHSLSSRMKLFLDESAHDWRQISHGFELGWNGVALKTCKTQTGALLSLAWARAHKMDIMVQDLTNPMLAAIPHVRLAAHANTLAGVETNAMQFYPAASQLEAHIHPRLYERRHGKIDIGSLSGSGFGMRVEEINRLLPKPHAVFGSLRQDSWNSKTVSRVQ